MIYETPVKNIHGSQDVAEIFRAILNAEEPHDQSKEHFWVVGLNTKNMISFVDLVSMGSLNNCLCYPREVFRLAVMRGVYSVALCHNHPSGDTTPSAEDREITARLISAGEILGIGVLDHIIICGSGYYSFCDNGFIKIKERHHEQCKHRRI